MAGGCARRTRDRLHICWTSRFLRNHITGIFTCGFQKCDGGKRERHPVLIVGPIQTLALTAGVKIIPAEQRNAAVTVTGAAVGSGELATGPVNPTATVPATELGNAAVTGTGAAATPDSGDFASVPASVAAIVPATDRRTAPVHLDVHAELDDDEQPEDTTLGPGVMQSYLRAVPKKRS